MSLTDTVPSMNSEIAEAADTVTSHFRFIGDGASYFRIWIVNLLLTVITFGIYSAWAKVIREQYFHRHLLLDGSAFDYLGTPKAILNGRAIAVLMFVALSVAQQVSALLHGILSLALVLALPWLAIRAMQFRARNTVYRGLPFDFQSSYGAAAKVFFGYGLLTLLTLGLAFPLFYRQLRLFVLNHARYGTTSFLCTVPVGVVYRIFLTPTLLVLGIPLLLIVITRAGDVPALAPLFVLGLILLYFFVMAYVAARMTNAVWSATTLGAHRFSGTLPIAAYLRLTLGNWLGIIITLGLFIPWARVRTARLRAEHLHLSVAGDLDQFIASEAAKVSALGEGASDIFDVDIAL